MLVTLLLLFSKKNKSKRSKPTSLSRTNAFLKKENKQTNRQKRMVRELVRVIPQKKNW